MNDLSEKEQMEAIRGWWQENGRYIISGVAIGVALLVGWNYWTNQKEQAAVEASALYESLVQDVAEVEIEGAEKTAANLYENYHATVYARQARLAMAKLYMSVGQDQDAADELAALLEQGENPEMTMVARLRLAKILLYQEKPAEVVDLLQGHGETAFAARYFEALGDAYVQLERYDEAAEAYTAALADNTDAPTINRTLVQMKINDLPKSGATETPETDAAGAPAASDGPAATDVSGASGDTEATGEAGGADGTESTDETEATDKAEATDQTGRAEGAEGADE